eukprot:CAMPEP_0198723274 /NCGR_PEP_ID=MMETSP1475-20131203/814_1 /TAXON_ID= ORGANISM="Unidentified sp., Strain CCMP1999" /NCGR_SAMPLE_ID=MMETSP1475 /ASSEMBLY_ACC=CAM_ASM_001111 /LENGTH=95 /DNA_ID=CAMNT_0044484351 /DNA_START=50 /DNA_END=333 /DNA_ORIENTATION=+
MFAGLTAGEIAGRRPWELVRATLGAMLVFSAAKTSFGGNRGGDNVRVKISAAETEEADGHKRVWTVRGAAELRGQAVLSFLRSKVFTKKASASMS